MVKSAKGRVRSSQFFLFPGFGRRRFFGRCRRACRICRRCTGRFW